MRILLLTLIVFVLAGVSIGLTQFDMSYVASRLSPQNLAKLVFEVEPEADKKPDGVQILRARPDGVMLLNRSSRTQTARYALPQDAGIVSGVLKLDTSIQMSDEQHGVLRVAVGNQTRGEVILRPGQYNVTTDIGLDADDLAAETLAIRYSLISPEDDGACTTASFSPSIVEIEQSSRVVLEVINPNLTPRDEVSAAGNVVLIGWPKWLSEEQRRYRWKAAQSLSARGFEVRLVDAPDSVTLSGKPLVELVESDVLPVMLTDEDPAWPEYLSQVGGNAGMRSFQETTTWRHWYRVGRHDHLSAPASFAYDVMLGPLPNDAKWTVTITHNGSIIEAREVEGRVGSIQGVVSLKTVDIEQSNLIEVTATSGYEPTGLCNNGPDLFAELRPETRLIGGGPDIQNDITPLTTQLARKEPLTVALPLNMSLVEAQRLLHLVMEVAPEGSDIRLVEENARISPILRRDFRAVSQSLPNNAVLVWFDDAELIHARAVNDLDPADPEAMPSGALAIAITMEEEQRNSQLMAQ